MKGRRPLRPDEKSEPVMVRFAQSDFDLLDRWARERGTSKAAIIREWPAMIVQLQTRIESLQSQLDALIVQHTERATPEEASITMMRLLSAKVETRSTTEAAVVRFLERWPTDIYAAAIRQLLGRFQQANAEHPGAVSDDDLWLRLQHGDRWEEMKRRLQDPVVAAWPSPPPRHH